jgi:hypothetical protein
MLQTFKLSDCTLSFSTLMKFLEDPPARLKLLDLEKVGLLPYGTLGYVSKKGAVPLLRHWLLQKEREILETHVEGVRKSSIQFAFR